MGVINALSEELKMRSRRVGFAHSLWVRWGAIALCQTGIIIYVGSVDPASAQLPLLRDLNLPTANLLKLSLIFLAIGRGQI